MSSISLLIYILFLKISLRPSFSSHIESSISPASALACHSQLHGPARSSIGLTASKDSTVAPSVTTPTVLNETLIIHYPRVVRPVRRSGLNCTCRGSVVASSHDLPSAKEPTERTPTTTTPPLLFQINLHNHKASAFQNPYDALSRSPRVLTPKLWPQRGGLVEPTQPPANSPPGTSRSCRPRVCSSLQPHPGDTQCICADTPARSCTGERNDGWCHRGEQESPGMDRGTVE